MVLLGVAAVPVAFICAAMLRSPTPSPVGRASLEGLVTQRGEVLQTSTLHDRYKLLAFGYTQCPAACPATLAKLRQLLTGLGSAAGNRAPCS